MSIQHTIKIFRNPVIEFQSVIPIGLVIQRREVPPMRILDQLNAFIALGRTQFISPETV